MYLIGEVEVLILVLPQTIQLCSEDVHLGKLEIKSPYTLLKLSYLEIREAEIKKFLHEYCQTLLLLIGKNKFTIGHFGQ